MQTILTKLHVHSRLDPPPLPPAASAALAVPIQQAEDVPTHVGRHVRRKGGSALQVSDRLEEDRVLRAVLVGMLREMGRK
jgi:hypothetical protein